MRLEDAMDEMTEDHVWVRCEIGPGMFSNEVSVVITNTNGRTSSFFVPAYFIRPIAGTDNEGEICLEVLARGESFVNVALPREAFEGGYSAAVRIDMLTAA